MAFKEVWDEELQEWVYEDPDAEESAESIGLGGGGWLGEDKSVSVNSIEDVSRICAPIHVLEAISHVRKNKEDT